ncbi:MAG: DNA-processing protein DprA [Planctomycetota bacterium]
MPEATATPTSSHRSMLALTLVAGLGPARIRRLVAVLGSAERAAHASAADLSSIPSIGEATARKLAAGLAQSRQETDAELELVERAGVKLVAYTDGTYPAALRHDEYAPALLYVRGTLDGLADRGLGIVGSRKCSAYGLDQAARFAGTLAGQGWWIVSGGARGIDTAAHRAALRVNGQTVAVLGCGLGRCYPEENAPLFDEIAEDGGAVVSELPMRRGPEPRNFPARNRIIAGLSRGVLVVEAARGSGALITARQAGEQGRDVMAVPGRADLESSRGCHDLIRDGATLVSAPEEAAEMLESGAAGVLYQPPPPATASRDGLNADGATDYERIPNSVEDRVLAALDEPLTMDQVCVRLGLPPEQVRASVTLLEVRRRIRRQDGRLLRSR